MSKIIFTLGASTFTFSCHRDYPVADPVQVNVPVDYSDGGQLYAYNKGIEEQFFDLVFDNCNSTDYGNVDTWIKTTAVGPKNAFTMTDESGVSHTVRMLDTKNPLRLVGVGKYSGTIHLRKEI